MRTEFNPIVMNGNLSRLCLEQFAEQGELAECRGALYHIYCQLNGPSPESFASLLTVACDSISASIDASVLTGEGLHLLSQVRRLRQAFRDKESFSVQLRNQFAVEFDDYQYICVGLGAVGLDLYEPISFDEPSGEISDAVVTDAIARVSEFVLSRDTFSVRDLISGKRQKKALLAEFDDFDFDLHC